MEEKLNYNVGVVGSICIGTLDMIIIVSVVLKLLKVITWSWIIVLIPLWIELAVLIISLIVLLAFWLFGLLRR